MIYVENILPLFSYIIITTTSLSLFQTPRRRFLKYLIIIIIMSQEASKNNAFATPQSLSDWLKPRLPSKSFASWGVNPGTKNVHNLWIELSEGESLLDDSTAPPRRTVRCVVVRIFGPNGGTILIESDQELSDGSFRHRGKPLGEKMKAGETVEAAAMRAVKEELGGVDHGVVRIVPGSQKMEVSERNSGSNPGLPCRYVVHAVDAFVEGLPDGNFTTVEDEFSDGGKAITVKKYFWKWAPIAQLQPL